MAINAHAYTQEECIDCHKTEGRNSSLHISIEEFKQSVHGDIMICLDCHSDIEGREHESSGNFGRVDCGQCHEQENKHGFKSENEDRPECYSCHGKHNILEKSNIASSVHREQLKNTCSNCHPTECGEAGYLSRLTSLRIKSHKKQDFSRDYQRTNCIGCHQGDAAHGEKAPLDTQDCYKCHMDLKDYPLITGYIHAKSDHKNQPVIISAALVYAMFILVVIGCVFKYRGSGILNKSKKSRE